MTITSIVTEPNTAIATAVLSSETVTVTGVVYGTTTVVVEVSDGTLTADVTVPITVSAAAPTNHAPTAKSPVPTQTITGTGTASFIAADVAEDEDAGDTLTITSIITDPNAAIATAVLSSETVTVTGVVYGTTTVVVEVSDGTWTVDVTVPITVSATTAPTISASSASGISATTATLNFTSDEAGTYYYLVYAAADAAPDAATIKAQGAAIAKGTAAAAAAANTAKVTGLSASSSYKAYVIVEDAVSNTSAVTSISFTTKAVADNGRNSTSAVANEVDIQVNGKIFNAGTITNITEGSKTICTVTVDEKKLEQKLAEVGNNAVVTIPINSKADVIIGKLNGQMLKNMANKQDVLEVKTDNVSYMLSAQDINIDTISKQFGQSVELKDITVQIQIAGPTDETAKIAAKAAEAGGFTIVVPPITFTLTCTSNNRTIEISNFNAYVERTVAIPDGADPDKITTAVVIDPDGTVRHVPTIIVAIDGKYYAKINSLTNSTYSVVWHPLEFKDAVGHWAKEEINDMGSRMVISGIGNDMFEPDRDITRAEFAAVVVRALGLKPETGNNPFTDVKDDAWYGDFVKTASEYKIISGYGNGQFGPMDKITREQAMTMIARAMDITGLTTEFPPGQTDELLSGFKDGDNSSEYAKESIAACVEAGIVSGKNEERIVPQDSITRAEVAVIVRRLLQKSSLI